MKGLNGLTDNVMLAAGSGVTVTPSGNTLTIAAEAANPDQNAFQVTGVLNMLGDTMLAETTIAVPSGRRFVIEYVNVDVLLSGASLDMDVRVITTGDGVAALYFIPPQPRNGFGATSSLPLKIYADGDFRLQANRAAGGQSLVRVVFSGHLIDL